MTTKAERIKDLEEEVKDALIGYMYAEMELRAAERWEVRTGQMLQEAKEALRAELNTKDL